MSQTNWLNFDSDSPEAGVLLAWWKGLDEDRGGRAALRRCRTLEEVAFVPAFHRLRRALLSHGAMVDERIAALAAALAHVKDHQGGTSLPRQMATPRNTGGGAVVSGLRFRRLLQHEDAQSLLPALVRVIRLLGRAVNVVSLAHDVATWNARTRKDWAYAYYDAAPANEA